MNKLFLLIMLAAAGYGIYQFIEHYKVLPTDNICGDFTFSRIYLAMHGKDEGKVIDFYKKKIRDCRILILNPRLYAKGPVAAKENCSVFLASLGADTREYADFLAYKKGEKRLAIQELKETLNFIDTKYCPTGAGQQIVTREIINIEGAINALYNRY